MSSHPTIVNWICPIKYYGIGLSTLIALLLSGSQKITVITGFIVALILCGLGSSEVYYHSDDLHDLLMNHHDSEHIWTNDLSVGTLVIIAIVFWFFLKY